VAFRSGEILIAHTEGLYSAPYTPRRLPLRRGEQRLLAALPGGGGHTSRTVRVGPDGRVYVSLGISGNCSNEYLSEDYPFEVRRGGVLVLEERGSKPVWRPFASGLRNPVGFDWQPRTGVLYATNNGPDHWGFELPPEYFSKVRAGSFHGMPWFQYDGETLLRDDCIRTPPPRPARDVQRPVATFPPRNAPMAVAFVPLGALEPDLEGDAIVALRGSWGTRPHGRASGDPATRREPKLVRVRFDDGDAQGVEDLVTGFQLPDGSRWARPVGVAFGPDGALYFTSDSGANALFRISRSGDRRQNASTDEPLSGNPRSPRREDQGEEVNSRGQNADTQPTPP
jgi:glucose/arabinose dehydrogenase